MRRHTLWIIVLLIAIAALCSACGHPATNSASAAADPPATVEHIAGTNVSRVILTAEAMRRIGLQTAPVREAQDQGALQEVVPYSAVFYDLNGATWVYTVPEPRTYVRVPITVASINGDDAFLSAGPSVGAMVVVVGAPELYGAEFGVGQ